jgi:hypothetical protein
MRQPSVRHVGNIYPRTYINPAPPVIMIFFTFGDGSNLVVPVKTSESFQMPKSSKNLLGRSPFDDVGAIYIGQPKFALVISHKTFLGNVRAKVLQRTWGVKRTTSAHLARHLSNCKGRKRRTDVAWISLYCEKRTRAAVNAGEGAEAHRYGIYKKEILILSEPHALWAGKHPFAEFPEGFKVQ